MLEEIKVSSGFLDGVVHRTRRRFTVRALQAAAGFEVELDIEAAVVAVEIGRCDQPRRRDAERKLKEVIVTLEATWRPGRSWRPNMPPHRKTLKDKP